MNGIDPVVIATEMTGERLKPAHMLGHHVRVNTAH